MKHHETNLFQNHETRRDFIKKTAAATAFVAGASILHTPVHSQTKTASVALVLDAADALVKTPPVQ